jgi:hypothetical protein
MRRSRQCSRRCREWQRWMSSSWIVCVCNVKLISRFWIEILFI